MPGQIAFPGGKIDPRTRAPVAAALREARRKSASRRCCVEPLGYLDLYLTFSGFRIVPTVARVKPDFALALNPREVDRSVRSAAGIPDEPENHQRKSASGKASTRQYYAIPFENATFGASPQESCAICTNGFTAHDPA